MIEYIVIFLGLIIVFYLEKHRRILLTIREWAGVLDERQSELENAQEISYMVPYEKKGKKGKKKLTKKMYEDDEDIIYKEEDNKVYHEKKR
jgi:hypothetical protein